MMYMLDLVNMMDDAVDFSTSIDVTVIDVPVYHYPTILYYILLSRYIQILHEPNKCIRSKRRSNFNRMQFVLH